MQTIEVSDEVYLWLMGHREVLAGEGKSASFDDVIRDLYDRYHRAAARAESREP
jgi:predicted CopG family antitoxin